MQNTDLHNRIKEIRTKEKLNQKEFCDKIKITQPALSQIEAGKILPSIDTIRLIISEFDISYNWLIDGKGDMSNSLSSELSVIKPKANNISLMDISVAAGTISDTDIAGQVIETFSLPNLRGTGYYGLYVDGDSMTPTYHHGDLVVVKRIDNASFKSDEVYLVNLRGSLPVLKRVRRISQRNFELHSDNPSIGPYNIEVDSIADFFRVYSVIRHK